MGTAAMSITTDLVSALELLFSKLKDIGNAAKAVEWFTSYLAERMLCMY